jgi:hypothetical protein
VPTPEDTEVSVKVFLYVYTVKMCVPARITGTVSCRIFNEVGTDP